VPVPICSLTEQHLAPFDVEDATRTYDDLRVVGRESTGAARRQQLNLELANAPTDVITAEMCDNVILPVTWLDSLR
jgi:hypothetical protein